MNKLALRVLPLLALLLGLASGPLHAQQNNVEIMAGLLSAEDARSFDEPLLSAALLHSDSTIRSLAAMSAGRLRDSRAIPLLLPLLRDRDSLTQAVAIFALGLIGDTAAVLPMIDRAREATPVSAPAALEMITAMARIGGGTSASFIRSVIVGTMFGGGRVDRPMLLARAALESYRLGRLAPVNDILGLMSDSKEEVRNAAAYSLGRLRAPAAGTRMLEALTDRSVPSRMAAAQSLTKRFADTAGLATDAVADQLARASEDEHAGVRVNALRSLGSYKLARLAKRIIPAVDDPVSNVQVQAVMTLGELGGPDAVAELTRVATGTKGTFARRREALLALAAADSAAFFAAAGKWAAGSDWRERAAAATGAARWGGGFVAPYLDDRDPKVVGAALDAWGEREKENTPALLAAGRARLQAADAGVRTAAADIVGRAPTVADIDALVASYQRAARDSFPDAALSVLNALNAIAATSPEARATVDRVALAGITQPTDYLVREWAEQHWPAATRAWGPAFPLRTGRTMEDYREIARRYLVTSSPARYPVVHMQIDGLGTVDIELFGPEAPLTVANYLLLVNRRYFDGLRFHRVVPNFVLQTGDPRGDGRGGPGGAIRDEINRRRYQTYYVGMALSGPDTGGSQWFITLSPQPHLDGNYTIFGRVSGGEPILQRVTQGDLIRTIRP